MFYLLTIVVSNSTMVQREEEMDKINFKQVRLSKGITQVEAAKICDVSLSTWLNWERGVGYPNFENKIKLQVFLDLPDKE